MIRVSYDSHEINGKYMIQLGNIRTLPRIIKLWKEKMGILNFSA